MTYWEPGGWSTGHGFVQKHGELRVDVVDASGASVPSFAGAVTLTSDCPIVGSGGLSHTYTAGDGGTHTFLVGLGDSVYFGAQLGVRYSVSPDPDQGGGTTCTVAAAAAGATGDTQRVYVVGEFCDNQDNNSNGVVDDDGFPELGTTAPDGGTYRCSTDGKTLVSVQSSG